VGYAKAQLGKPWRYAASGPDAYSSTGLTVRAYQSAGVPWLGMTMAGQLDSPYGTTHALANRKRGDLLFFDYGRGPANVAIYLGKNQAISAWGAGKVVSVRTLTEADYASVMPNVRRLRNAATTGTATGTATAPASAPAAFLTSYAASFSAA
jgi:cell wall-associated NlpC family hydrolase